jgi:hypothetical protein
MRRTMLVALPLVVVVLLVLVFCPHQARGYPSRVPDAGLAECYGGANCITCETLGGQCTLEATDDCEYTEYEGGSRMCIDVTQVCKRTTCSQSGKYCQNKGHWTASTCINDTVDCTGKRSKWTCLEIWFEPPQMPAVWCCCSPIFSEEEPCPGTKSACHYE